MLRTLIRETLYLHVNSGQVFQRVRTQFKSVVVWVGTWAAPEHVNSRRVGSFLRQMILCAAGLATLSVVGAVEKNSGPGMEGESVIVVLYSGCDKT